MCSRRLAGAALLASSVAFAAPLAPWSEGTLEIHHIATGRGNSTLLICPDGTTVLIDAGAVAGNQEAMVPAQPNDSRRPGEWIARYILRRLKTIPRDRLDYAVMTHLHPDHVGGITENSPIAQSGTFALTGISDVEAMLPIRTLVDRGFPHYDYPEPNALDFATNYISFVADRTRRGFATEQAQVGSSDQLKLVVSPAEFPQFKIRILAANGNVWNGGAAGYTTTFPALASLSPEDYPDENMCSMALLVSLGDFYYYTGGDLTSTDRYGDQPWRNIAAAVAKITGEVDVATADHHGYHDAVGPDVIRALRPTAWVVPSWHVTHPNIATLERMLSPALYPGPRDIFTTGLHPANLLLNERFRHQIKNTTGHVVVRVNAGGTSFRVYILDATSERDDVMAKFGPYLTH